jgi:phenylalanyl-tRNA synthetase beta chain
MKISYNWLNNYFDKKLPPPAAVGEALTFHAFEIDSVEPAPEGCDDTVLDVKVTPNRGHDCLGHRGIAKELSAILKLPINPAYDPLAKAPDLSARTDEVAVTIEEPGQCSRYIAGYLKGITVGPSPQWLKQSLEAVGQRSINNIVDATNLVMFNIGQPMHAFDAGKLTHGGKYSIVVRRAKEGEWMRALDGKDYTLNKSMLVIADQNADVPIGIAGVKGGMPAAITEATTDIVLEAATFDGVSVRKTAQALKLRTDASARFEQVLSSQLAGYAMRQAVDLILNIAGGKLEGFVDVYPSPQGPQYASVTVEKINSVLGASLTGADVADVFMRLGFAYKEEGGVFEVQVPFERLDIAIPEDLVEEVGRVVGYDRVPATPLPAAAAAPVVNANFYAAERAREELVAQGYSEVFTSVFADEGERAVANKIGGERPYLRNSLVPGLAEALAKNLPNKDLLGLKEVKLFEIGPAWKGGNEITMVGIADEKGVTEKPLEPISAAQYESLSVSRTERYRPFSKYPYIVRDIAMWVPAGTDETEVAESIKKEAGELAQTVRLFDRFEKAAKTSLAYRVVFQSFERTLTEAEVNAVMEKVAASLKAKGFEIR